MERNADQRRSYWSLLEAAEEALAEGDFATSERRFESARVRRAASPGRIFFTERLPDGLGRLVSRRGTAGDDEPDGRWNRRAADFRAAFASRGEERIREAVRIAELRPEDNAETNQPLLTAALFLVARSRLVPAEPTSAVTLLKGLFRTAHRTGRPFTVDLLRHDLPLSEEDRLWLARKGASMLENFVENGRLERGAADTGEWAEAVLQLLQPRYFGSAERLQDERAWLEAVSADRLLGRADASVRLYRAYLDLRPEPGPRADEARVRLLELLANVGGDNFPVPRYGEALDAMQSAGLAAGSAVAGRYQEAVACIEHRRPEPTTGATSRSWSSAALTSAGEVSVVFWWGDEPRDLARWSPGEDAAAIDRFLAPCGERVVAADLGTVDAVGDAWEAAPAPWPVLDFAALFAEPLLPRTGCDRVALARLAAAETGPWRAGWRRDLGRPELAPVESPVRDVAQVDPALLAGLVWLAVGTQVAGGDPSLRAGIGEMARRGDPAASFLYGCLILDGGESVALDASFEPWTLPLLWTRPDPLPTAGATGAASTDLHPDLGRNPLAIVTTGDPGAVVAAWGEGQHRWRLVLDRPDRLDDLAPVLGMAGGPLTIVPAAGQVHDLATALRLLEDLLPGGPSAPAADPLLPLCHWLRLVSTHNGDLLDLRVTRPTRPGAYPLLDRYADLVAALPRHQPALDDVADAGGWHVQYAQRARRAGCVAGRLEELTGAGEDPDALWGVFEGSGASWILLDAAVIHQRLTDGDADAATLHARLSTRGERLLALLTGAVWSRRDVEDQLADHLAIYGDAFTLALTDLRAPLLLLADRGVVPDARVLGAESLATAVLHLERVSGESGRRVVLPPATTAGATFWTEAARTLAGVAGDWQVLPDTAAPAGDPREVLCLPALAGLAGAVVRPGGDDAVAWREADQERRAARLAARRRCSLELAAHLAGRWSAVEVLDPRWWPLVRPDGAGGEGRWSGERALAMTAPAGARCFDLPPVAGGDREAARLLADARAWLVRRGTTETPRGRVPGGDGDAVLQVGAGAEERSALLATVRDAWEQGDLARWLLVVDDAGWPEAGQVVADLLASGQSCWNPAALDTPPAPVLWARPADVLEPGFAAYLETWRPQVILVPALQAWLPEAQDDARGGALALRSLLDHRNARLVVQAAELAPPWADFLAASVGLRESGPRREEAGPAPPGGRLPAALLVARLSRLLRRLRPLLEERAAVHADSAGGGLASARELVSLYRLGTLAGLPTITVRDGLRTLRWAASLAGDTLSDADAGGPPEARARGHALLIRHRFAELEHGLEPLREHLDLFLPLLMAGLLPGAATWADLAAPPARIDPEDLQRLDTFLLSLQPERCGLAYTAPGGVLGSTRRLLVLHHEPSAVRGAVLAELELFRRRVQDVMGSAVETGDGLLVDTGLTTLRDEEERFLALGAALDEWRWLGPGGADALHVVDLLTLADGATARSGGAGWQLVGELLGRVTDTVSEPARRGKKAGRWRAFLPGERGADPWSDAVGRIAALGGEPDAMGQVVLRGLAGSGRVAAVLAGLARARRESADAGPVTVCCPDVGTAAHVHRRSWREGLALDLRLPRPGDPLPSAPDASLAAAAQGDVVVLVEAQRFAPELRYRVAQFGRGRRLVMTADPVASREPWENLFLTTPRADDVIDLGGQRELARRIWQEVSRLAGDQAPAEAPSRRRERGDVVAEYAANLDQCVARIRRAREEGLLPTRFRVTAPLAEDLAYVGDCLRGQGWLAVDEEEVDALCLPGPCELLAAAADLLAGSGDLGRAFGGDAAGVAAVPGLLGALPGGAATDAAWPPEDAPAPDDLTLGELGDLLLSTPDLASSLRHPEARARMRALLATWGPTRLVDLPREPLWVAWWASVVAELDLGAPGPGRPLALLTPGDRLPAAPVPGGVYLCLGSERPRQHYRVLSHITDSALVLYQERSPLAAAGGD